MLHSVQHLFLSTASPSLPWVETKTQTKKSRISPPSTVTEKAERGIQVVMPRPRFPRVSPPRLPQTCSCLAPASVTRTASAPGAPEPPAPPLSPTRRELVPLPTAPHGRGAGPCHPPACPPSAFIPARRLWVTQTRPFPAVGHQRFLLPRFREGPQSSGGTGRDRGDADVCRREPPRNQGHSHGSPGRITHPPRMPAAHLPLLCRSQSLRGDPLTPHPVLTWRGARPGSPPAPLRSPGRGSTRRPACQAAVCPPAPSSRAHTSQQDLTTRKRQGKSSLTARTKDMKNCLLRCSHKRKLRAKHLKNTSTFCSFPQHVS